MSKSFKDKVVDFFDKENTGDNPYPYIILSVITIMIGKSMNAKVVVCILAAMTMSCILGLVIQLFKKEKNTHNIICYLWATLLLIFITVMIFILEDANNKSSNMYIKMCISGIAFFMDILALYAIMVNKTKSKLVSIITIILFTLVAICAVIFLPNVAPRYSINFNNLSIIRRNILI